MLKSLLISAVFAACAFAQGGPAYHVGSGTSLPSKCNPQTGDVFVLYAGSSGALYNCTGVNTWTSTGNASQVNGGTIPVSAPVVSTDASGKLIASPTITDDGTTLSVTGRNLSVGTTVPVGAPTNSFSAGAVFAAGSSMTSIGPPISSCGFGAYTYQVDAIAGSLWFCNGFSWVNVYTGAFSFPFVVCHYWVDSVNGSDGNAGLSPTQPFLTLVKMSTITLVQGDTICLAANSHFRGMLTPTTTISNISIYGYGTGAKPILDASAVAANASFTLTSGCTATYQITVSPTFSTTAGSDFVNVWENDLAFIRQGLSGGCLDTAPIGAYFPSSDNGPGTHAITLYIHASDGSNIISNGKTYEYSAQEEGLNAVGSTYLTVQNIVCKKNLGIDGSGTFGRYARILNSEFWDGSKHNLYYQDGAYLQNALAYRAYYNSAVDMYIGSETSPISAGLTLINCTAEMSTSAPIIQVEGFGVHAVAGGNFGTVIYVNPQGLNLGSFLGAGTDATGTNITNAYAVNCLYGIDVDGPSVGGGAAGPTIISGFNMQGNASTFYAIQINAANLIATADHVTFNSLRGASALLYINAVASATVTITNSTIIRCTDAIDSFATTATITSQGNTFRGAYNKYYNLGSTTTFAGLNNNYGTGSGSVTYNGTTYTYANWKALGLDVNATP